MTTDVTMRGNLFLEEGATRGDLEITSADKIHLLISGCLFFGGVRVNIHPTDGPFVVLHDALVISAHDPRIGAILEILRGGDLGERLMPHDKGRSHDR